MSYPGNPSLAQDVQDRIASTFEHALDLVTQGREPEAQLGCEFILRMDPMHRPAGRLLERLKSGRRPVALDDLRPALATGPDDLFAGDPGALDDFGGLEELDDLGTFDDLEGLRLEDENEPSEPALAAKPAIGFAAVLQDLLTRRNYQQVLQIAETQRQAIEKDPQLRAMVEIARAKLESEPYVRSFLDSARQASIAGHLDEANKFLDKARALEPDHPEIDRLRTALAAARHAPLDLDDNPPLTFDEAPASAPTAHGDPFASQLAGAPQAAEEPDFFADDVLSFEAEPTPAVPADPLPSFAAGGEDRGGSHVSKLLQEGQDAFDRGEYQSAIDVWSRIFLIDVDNQEASQRIEEARNKKAELERQAEEIFYEGVTQLESRSGEEAKATFRRVLALQPSHSLAREYLEQLEAGHMPVIRPSGGDALDSGVDDLSALAAASLATGARPAKSMEAAVERDRIVVVKKTDRRLIFVGAAVLVLVLGAVAFLVLKWDDLFPNTESATSPAVPQQNPIEQATALYEEGKADAALLVLQRIQPQDPIYDQAQGLLAQWKAASEAAATPVETGPTEAQRNRRNLLVQAAREARAQEQYLRTRKYLERAAKILPLAADELALQQEAEGQLLPLQAEIQLFDQGEYATALPALWRKREENRLVRDIDLLIIDSYYNLALRDLQRGETVKAAEKLADAVGVDPDNRELQRLKLFADTYVDRPQDVLYRIFVKYLPSR